MAKLLIWAVKQAGSQAQAVDAASHKTDVPLLQQVHAEPPEYFSTCSVWAKSAPSFSNILRFRSFISGKQRRHLSRDRCDSSAQVPSTRTIGGLSTLSASRWPELHEARTLVDLEIAFGDELLLRRRL